MGIANADTAEHGRTGTTNLIVPVSCALPGRLESDPMLSGFEDLTLVEGTRLAAIMSGGRSRERHFCNYEVDEGFRWAFESLGLRIAALGARGETRAVELPEHPFFVATLFQPQLTSKASGVAHPLVRAFVSACAAN